MANHPNRTPRKPRPNAIFFHEGLSHYAIIATEGGIIETCMLHEGRYVRVDDGRQYPQLCVGAAFRGNTLIYGDDKQLASDCNATIYKTRAGFDHAAERIVIDDGMDGETIADLNREAFEHRERYGY